MRRSATATASRLAYLFLISSLCVSGFFAEHGVEQLVERVCSLDGQVGQPRLIHDFHRRFVFHRLADGVGVDQRAETAHGAVAEAPVDARPGEPHQHGVGQRLGQDGAQQAVLSAVGLVQDQEGRVGDEPAHVVLGVLHLAEIVAQGPFAVEGLRVGHQPLLDHVGGHQGQAGALQDLPPLGEVAHVAVDAVDAARFQAGGLGHALPADDLVSGQGLDGIDGDGRGGGIGDQMVQGGRLEHQ